MLFSVLIKLIIDEVVLVIFLSSFIVMVLKFVFRNLNVVIMKVVIIRNI